MQMKCVDEDEVVYFTMEHSGHFSYQPCHCLESQFDLAIRPGTLFVVVCGGCQTESRGAVTESPVPHSPPSPDHPICHPCKPGPAGHGNLNRLIGPHGSCSLVFPCSFFHFLSVFLAVILSPSPGLVRLVSTIQRETLAESTRPAHSVPRAGWWTKSPGLF